MHGPFTPLAPGKPRAVVESREVHVADTTTGPATGTPTQAEQGSGSASALEGMGDRVRGAAGQVQQRVQGTTGDAMHRAREQAIRRVDQQSTELGHRVSRSADDLRSVGDHLRSQGRTGPADLADKLRADGRRALADALADGETAPGWAVGGERLWRPV